MILLSVVIFVTLNLLFIILVNKIFLEQTPEPKVKVLIPMYEPLEVTKCKKCGKIIAEPKELIRIRKRERG